VYFLKDFFPYFGKIIESQELKITRLALSEASFLATSGGSTVWLSLELISGTLEIT
jgi:hypothetical protein